MNRAEGTDEGFLRGVFRALRRVFGRLTRITRALKIRDLDAALERTAALVDDWDGGTRIGPTLLAFLGVPRFAACARTSDPADPQEAGHARRTT